MKKPLSILMLILFALTANCQKYLMSGENFDSISFNIESYSDIQKYSGVYRFGMSEWESDLVIYTVGNETILQIRYSNWVLDNNQKVIGTKFVYENLNNVKIEFGKLISDELKGYFVMINDANHKGLALLTEVSLLNTVEKNEFGLKTGSIGNYYFGDYKFASWKLLRKEELTQFSKEKLRIIRNEIFARYEYDFKSGGEMEKYFEKKSWYRANYKDVNDFLTTIEKKNIKLIKSLE